MNDSSRRINALARQVGAHRYLEIGVNKGETFHKVDVADKTGVDPNFAFETSEFISDFTRFVPKTSDEFFSIQPLFPPYDIVFIDGLHTFEQVVRDFSNVILYTHRRSIIILDDTLPIDIYSAIPDMEATFRHRKALGNDSEAWHGDVFKTVFYIHDFWPSLNYRTIIDSGNPQTVVWRSNGIRRKPLFNNLERISRLTYFDLQDNLEILQTTTEGEAVALCINETRDL